MNWEFGFIAIIIIIIILGQVIPVFCWIVLISCSCLKEIECKFGKKMIA